MSEPAVTQEPTRSLIFSFVRLFHRRFIERQSFRRSGSTSAVHSYERMRRIGACVATNSSQQRTMNRAETPHIPCRAQFTRCLHLDQVHVGDGIAFTSSVHGSRRRRILPSHLVQVQAHVRRRYCLHLLFEFTWEYPVRKTATRSSNILPFITPATRTLSDKLMSIRAGELHG